MLCGGPSEAPSCRQRHAHSVRACFRMSLPELLWRPAAVITLQRRRLARPLYFAEPTRLRI